MSDNRTASILQRAPVILAVTAASYGLPLQPRAARAHAAGQRAGHGQGAAVRRRRAEAHR